MILARVWLKGEGRKVKIDRIVPVNEWFELDDDDLKYLDTEIVEVCGVERCCKVLLVRDDNYTYVDAVRLDECGELEYWV